MNNVLSSLRSGQVTTSWTTTLTLSALSPHRADLHHYHCHHHGRCYSLSVHNTIAAASDMGGKKHKKASSSAAAPVISILRRPDRQAGNGISIATSTNTSNGKTSCKHRCFTCDAAFPNTNLLQLHVKNHKACNIGSTNLASFDTTSRKASSSRMHKSELDHAYKGLAAPTFVKATELTTTAIRKIEGVVPRENDMRSTSDSDNDAAVASRSKGQQRVFDGDVSVALAATPIARAISRDSTASSAAGWSTVSDDVKYETSSNRTPAHYLQNYVLPNKGTLRPFTPSESGESDSIASSTEEVVYQPLISRASSSIHMHTQHTPQQSISSEQLSTARTIRQLSPSKTKLSPVGVLRLPLSTYSNVDLAPQKPAASAVGVFGLPLPSTTNTSEWIPEILPSTGQVGVFGLSLPSSPASIAQDPSTVKKIPFVKPFTAFDMLERSIQALNIAPNAQSTQREAYSPNTSAAVPSPVKSMSIQVPAVTATIPQSSLSGKKVPRSPMLWGNIDGKFTIDAPTLGSPTLGSMTDTYGIDDAVEQKKGVEDVQYHPDIAKASHTVAKEDILAQLKERKIAQSQMQNGVNAPNGRNSNQIQLRQQARSTHTTSTLARSKLAESETSPIREADDTLAVNHTKADNTNVMKLIPDENGILRQDMAESVATPFSSDGLSTQPKLRSNLETNPTSRSAPTPLASTLRFNGKEKGLAQVKKVQYAIDTLQETSAIQGTIPVDMTSDVQINGTTTGGEVTTTADEDTATESDASGTSILLRTVTRDVDNRGWEDTDTMSQQRKQQNGRLHLERAIHELNKRHRSSAVIAKQRQDIIFGVRRKLNGMLREYRPDFQYRLLPFGSTAYGLDTDRSDLDLCIIDPKRPDGFRNALDLYDIRADPTTDEPASTSDDDDATPNSPRPDRSISSTERKKRKDSRRGVPPPAGLDAIYNVHRVAGVLRGMRLREVHPIPSAGVPIVKFVSESGIKADLNSNEQLGVRNSALLRAYVNFHPLVRPFLVFLKTWAKQRKLNDSAGMKGPVSLSSYSLILMAIAYLQHVDLVPNLQDLNYIKHANQPREAFWTKIPNKDVKGARRGRYLGDCKAMAVETTFVRDMPPGSGWKCRFAQTESSNANNQNTQVVDLIEGFFDYYLGFPLEDQTISIWNGAPLPRQRGYSGHTDTDLSKRFEGDAAKEEEELYQRDLQEDSEALIRGVNGHTVGSGRQTPPSMSEDEEECREREEQSATLARIEAMLRAQGIESLGPSFQDRLKETRKLEKSTVMTATPTPSQNGHSRDGTSTSSKSVHATATNGLRVPAHTGLDLDDADPQTFLFPFPEQEDPKYFVEPPIWTQKLIVQDPFIHTRNTCLNIQPETVDRIIDEMHRARELLKEGAFLQELCLSYKRDPHWRPLSGPRGRNIMKVERREMKREKRIQKRHARTDEFHLKKKLHHQEKAAERKYEAQLAAHKETHPTQQTKAGFPASI